MNLRPPCSAPRERCTAHLIDGLDAPMEGMMKWIRSNSAAGRSGAVTRHQRSQPAANGVAAAQALTCGGTEASGCGVASPRAALAAYVPPRLERLGAWNALTLQQSVPIFP